MDVVADELVTKEDAKQRWPIMCKRMVSILQFTLRTVNPEWPLLGSRWSKCNEFEPHQDSKIEPGKVVG